MTPNWLWLFIGIIVGSYIIPMVFGAAKSKKSA